MVFFVCEGCNETLKKNKVDSHAARCRNCWAVSCVDCSVVFEGNDYAAHTSCISEAQKYEGSLYKEKAKTNKKQSPQERWMEVVQSAKCDNDPKLQNVLSRVASYDNVPRKRAKFLNFMKNSIALGDSAMVERVWRLYETQFQASEGSKAQAIGNDASETSNEPAAPESHSVNGKNNNKRNDREEPKDSSIPATKKSKTEAATDKPLKWSKIISATLKSAPEKKLDLNTLRDQVLQHIKTNALSTKDDKELKKEFKVAVRSYEKVEIVEIVRFVK